MVTMVRGKSAVKNSSDSDRVTVFTENRQARRETNGGECLFFSFSFLAFFLSGVGEKAQKQPLAQTKKKSKSREKDLVFFVSFLPYLLGLSIELGSCFWFLFFYLLIDFPCSHTRFLFFPSLAFCVCDFVRTKGRRNPRTHIYIPFTQSACVTHLPINDFM
jgi:hypothetical protein